MKAAAPVADTMGGLSAAIAILGALMEAAARGKAAISTSACSTGWWR